MYPSRKMFDQFTYDWQSRVINASKGMYKRPLDDFSVSYPGVSYSILCRDMLRPEVKSLRSNYRIGRFLDAISEGNTSAGL